MCLIFVFLLVLCFSCSFSLFFGLGSLATNAHRLVSSASSRLLALFSSLRSSRLAPFSSLSPLAPPSFQLRPQSTAPSSPYCLRSTPFLSPAFLPLLPFFSPFSSSPFLPSPPRHHRGSYLSFGSLAVTDGEPTPPHPQIIKIPSQGAKPPRRTPGGRREGRGRGGDRQPESGAERAAPARLPPGELSAIGRAGCIKLLAINKARVRLCKA